MVVHHTCIVFVAAFAIVFAGAGGIFGAGVIFVFASGVRGFVFVFASGIRGDVFVFAGGIRCVGVVGGGVFVFVFIGVATTVFAFIGVAATVFVVVGVTSDTCGVFAVACVTSGAAVFTVVCVTSGACGVFAFVFASAVAVTGGSATAIDVHIIVTAGILTVAFGSEGSFGTHAIIGIDGVSSYFFGCHHATSAVLALITIFRTAVDSDGAVCTLCVTPGPKGSIGTQTVAVHADSVVAALLIVRTNYCHGDGCWSVTTVMILVAVLQMTNNVMLERRLMIPY